jgi:HD-GYP domain-containing protein (c-di-GMP phosphodiesterase class II)
VSICDAYDAMTSRRPYRPAMTSAFAITELRRGAGTQWDPDLVGLFLTSVLQEPWTIAPSSDSAFGFTAFE